jgi:hypothetical protein
MAPAIPTFFVAEGAKATVACPFCASENATHAEVAAVKITADGIHSVALVLDIGRDEVLPAIRRDPIGPDDVIEIHQLLQDGRLAFHLEAARRREASRTKP